VAVHFFPKKVDDLFLVVVTFKRTLNVQTSKQRGKNLAADRRGPPCDGALSHGTTGTMDNPALNTNIDIRVPHHRAAFSASQRVRDLT